MPKHERGSPKDIAARIKAKGLQKLKFYCQMCSKQCRDENGFKCHIASDSHLRQMKIFSENADGILDEFSKEFEESYLETLRRRHGTKRMNANNVYQEVIQDKHHVHMNSTKWATLTDFVQYLGKKGLCVVEETERGWYVTYVQRDPALLARQEAQKRRAEAERAEEIKTAKRMELQRIEAAKALDRAGGTMETVASKLGERRAEGAGGEKVAIKLGGGGGTAGGGKKRKEAGGGGRKSVLDDDDDDDDDDEHDEEQKEGGSAVEPASFKGDSDKGRKKRRWGPRDEIADDAKVKFALHDSLAKSSDGATHVKGGEGGKSGTNDERNKRKEDNEDVRKENWIHKDIVVRVISKKLAKGAYYKRKGVIDRIIDKYTAEVEILDSGPDEKDGGDIVRLDQDDLETVVPKETGKKVRILNGRGRGRVAEVINLDKKRYLAALKLVDDGRVIEGVDYDDFSKLA